MKSLRIAASVFVLLLLAGFALAFSVYQSYTDLADLHGTAKSRFADWEAALAPRRVLIEELAEITGTYDPSASGAASEAEQLLKEADPGSDVSARINMHKLYEQMLESLRGRAVRYPQLRDSDLFHEWEAEYLKGQIVEEAARLGYNAAARDYNAVLDRFTGKLIAVWFTVTPKPVITG
ncbi:MAG: LemA family protein [bacterium]|nr:LemA family protein [bacterium]